MLIQRLIDRYKTYRKTSFLNQPFNYKHQYAFIGTGQHSFSNLYPAIHYLGIPLKTICTRHLEHAQKMAARFPGCAGTDRLADIINDPAIKGVFVCATPVNHAAITRELLLAGKHVFVEKPPCFSLQELQNLIKLQGPQHGMPGLQKRFSPINKLLEPFRLKTTTYCYRYLTGAYPEGDAVFELFIHPVDNCIRLFGNIQNIQVNTSLKNNITCFLSIQHTNGITGMVHLSTDHSWQFPVDELEMNTPGAIFQASYPNKLISIEKSSRFLNIPLEKIFQTPVVKKVHLDNTGFIPVAGKNNLAMQGFSGEIAHFTNSVEQSKYSEQHSLQSLVTTYEVLEKIKTGIGNR
ncbi:Gfo/Idh/MocA family oxidoreductase [Niastella caeni]|uniref:Gfo/Idh/MocA family oxidoreductase n=1 Tax=Niastella caeni TaxID=2569763 RepID=A0A4S8HFP2_9BACT|nr:Gfo/Idh/MocA family oxidoreductase [Niastella caeni]THU32939.1 Gfo/Idh/MocA family oxidoreductase [Niastella caeni]